MWIAWIATSRYNNDLSSKNIVLCAVYSVCQRSNVTSGFFVFNNACPSLTFSFQSPIEVYSFNRPVSLTSIKNNDSGPHTFLRGGFRTNPPRRQNCASLLSANQVIRALPPSKVPLKDIYPRGQSSTIKSWEHIRGDFWINVISPLCWLVVWLDLQMSRLQWQQGTWR